MVSEKKLVHRTGISDKQSEDYGIINRVRSIDQKHDKTMRRHRSRSRSRMADEKDLQNPVTMVKKDSCNWSERGTLDSIGGVNGFKRPSKKAPRSRSRTRSEDGDDNRDDGGRGRSGERGGRSKSRGPLRSLRRSLSRSRKKKDEGTEDTKRGRGRRRFGNKLPPPLPPKLEEEKKEPEPEPEPEEDTAIDKLLAERQLLAEVEQQQDIPEVQKSTRPGIESLDDDDVMQLDENNTIMHVACLLHHSSSTILDRLESEPELARCTNNAYETPLHYAAMDKKGVDKEVLKELIHLNPEAVKQPNVQNSLPIHLACMAGAPSTYVIKTFLKMYPKATMMQSDFPLLFEDDMVDTTKDIVDVETEDSDDGSQFVTYKPKNITAVSGIANMFACTAPNQAAIDMANDRARRKMERDRSRYGSDEEEEEGPKMETGFSPLHLAVMNSANTSVIDMLLKVNRQSIHLKTSQGRTALDCAQYIVRQHWLYGTDDEESIQNTFGAIERLEGLMGSE